MDLIDAIPRGQRSAITKKALAEKLGCSTREVEKEIEELRKSGQAAICSDGSGYWRPYSPIEYEANVERRRHRLVNQARTLHGEKRLLARWRARVVEQQDFDWPMPGSPG